jgi:cytochrome o ubiquinol oxidase subunit 3
VAVNTSMLLFSSITYGFAMISLQSRDKGKVLLWLAITGLFGLAFLGIELTEFHELIAEGNGPSAARSSRPSSRWWAPTVCT